MPTLLVMLALMGGVLLFQSTAWSADLDSQIGAEKGTCRSVLSGYDASDEVCANVELRHEADKMAHRSEVDRVRVVPKENESARPLDACHVVHLIRNTEALHRDRFLELLFQDITIRGRLHLDKMDSVVRLVFQDVEFVDWAPSQSSAKAARGPNCSQHSATEVETSSQKTESPSLEPVLRGTSLVISGSRFRERVVFSKAEFAGHVVITGSQFEHSFNIADSTIGGDFVLEDLKFDTSLRLGEGTKVHGQVVVHDVRVSGDLDLDSMRLLPPPPSRPEKARRKMVNSGLQRTYHHESAGDAARRPLSLRKKVGRDIEGVWLGPSAPDYYAREYWKNMENLLSACVCVERNGTPRLDETKFKEFQRGHVEELCRDLAVRSLPRCPRSNGSEPLLIEISRVDVGASLFVAGLIVDLEAFSERASDEEACDESRDDNVALQCKAVRSARSRLKSEIALYDVEVAGSGLFSCNRTRAFWLNHSRLQRLQSENNIYGKFVASRNEFGSFKSVRDTFYNGIALTQNGFARSVEIDSGVFPLASEEVTSACKYNHEGATAQKGDVYGAQELSEEGFVNLANNSVGRDLTFTPYQLDRSRFRHIDLSSSRVAGVLGVNLPVACAQDTCDGDTPYDLGWSGQVQLSSVDVDGTLELRFARTDKQKRRATVVKPGVSQEAPFNLSCEKESVRIDVGNTDTPDFIWGLPITTEPERCFVWKGVGFRYANWHHENPMEKDNPGDHTSNFEDLKQWGELYHREDGQPEPSDPLHYIADYLGTHGEQRDSREVRGNAKAADFSVGEPAKACWENVENWWNEKDWSFSECGRTASNIAAHLIFWPTHYGTKPERALVILILATGFFYTIYLLSSQYWRRHKRWKELERARNSLVKRHRLEGDLQQHVALTDLRRALKDSQEDKRVSFAGIGPETDADITTVLDRHAPMPEDFGLSPGEVMHLSAVPGFMQYDRNRQPQDFGLFRYAVDVSIPVVDLHAYSQYFPASKWPRVFTTFQHILGWWVLTSLLATLAVF